LKKLILSRDATERSKNKTERANYKSETMSYAVWNVGKYKIIVI
jgi:hypothetical protein